MRILLLLIWPVLEILILVKIGGLIGFFGTLAIIILTAVIGIIIIKYGINKNILSESNTNMANNDAFNILIKKVWFIISGILLIIPGIITDIFGLVLLIPYTRKLIKIFPFYKLVVKNSHLINKKTSNFETTIEGEYNEVERDSNDEK